MLYYLVDGLRKALGMPLTDKTIRLRRLERIASMLKKKKSNKPHPYQEGLETVISDLIKVIEDYKSRKRQSEQGLESLEWMLHNALYDQITCFRESKLWKGGKMQKRFLMSLPTGAYIVSSGPNLDLENPGPELEAEVPEIIDREELWKRIKETRTDQRMYVVYRTKEDYYR